MSMRIHGCTCNFNKSSIQQQHEHPLLFSLYPPKVALCPPVGEPCGSIFLDEGLVKCRGMRGEECPEVLPKTGHDGLGTGADPRVSEAGVNKCT